MPWSGNNICKTILSSPVQMDRELLLYPRGVFSFGLSVRPFVCSFVRSFVTFVEFTSKFLVKVSLSEYISLTTHQKAFIFDPWVPERVSIYAIVLAPGFMPWGRAKGQNLVHC